MSDPRTSDDSSFDATLASDGECAATPPSADHTIDLPIGSPPAHMAWHDTIPAEPNALPHDPVNDATLAKGASARIKGSALRATLQAPAVGDPGTIDHVRNGDPLTEIQGTAVFSSEVAQHTEATGDWNGAAPKARTPADLAGIEKGYILLGELGRGGMGVVYKAQQRGVKRLVALKMILAGHHDHPERMVRFRTEAEAVANLRHPNIVQLYEVGDMEGKPYFSLEYVDGGSLAAKVHGKPQPPRQAAAIAVKLAEAMAYAHQNGILHRDLKPANVLLAADGTPKITDFGLAKRMEDQDSTVTQDGAVMGSPSYMAPEQAEGKIREVGTLADVYSLGAILYEMLSGRPPFKGETVIDTLALVRTQEPSPPRRDNSQAARDLEIICLKCLQKEPGKRYATAKELADDLHRFLNDEPILARPTPTWERLWKWSKHHRPIVALIGVGVLAVMAMVAFIAWHHLDLRDQLKDAIAAQKLLKAQTDGQALLKDAEVALAAGDWVSTRLHVNKALETIGSEPKLAFLKDPAQKLRHEAEGHLHSEAQFRKFGDLSTKAQFLGTLTGMALSGNLQAARGAVEQALAVYGMTATGQRNLTPQCDAYLSGAQRAEIQGDCYQLLLILAETECQSVGETPSPRKEKHLGEALALVEEARRFGGPSRAYYLRRARYLGILGDAHASREAEKDAAAIPVVQVLDWFLVGDEYYRRANFKEAARQFNEVLRIKPGHFWAQYLNAMCLLREQRFAEARIQFSVCLSVRADFGWVYLNRGFALAEMQEFDAAEADYLKASQMPLDDVSRYVLHVNRGVLYVQQDRPDKAIAELNEAIAMRPNDYQAHVNLARAYRQAQDLNLALRHMDWAVKLEPREAHLYRLRARLHLEREEAGPAELDFLKAIEHEKADSSFLADDHYELGRLLLHNKKYQAALASFEAALKHRPNYPASQRLRAEAFFNLGQFKEAIETFDGYLKNDGKPLESVYRGRGLARAELGKFPAAIEDYTKALEMLPSSAVYAHRGWAHMVVDAPKLALRDFETALELDPKNGDAHNGRGIILAGQGKHKEAMKDAEAALAYGPASPRLVYNAARICALCGDKFELRALNLLRQTLDLVPDDQRAAFWAKYIQPDVALQSLRVHPRYRQMAAEMSVK